MARAALAASRAIQIIDFLAAHGTAPFNLSELARALDINAASCHGILRELTKSGHLCRHPVHKTYSLGPVLVAIGDVAAENHEVIARAKAAAGELSRRLGLEVLLSMRAGDEVLGLAHFKQEVVARAWLRPGVRLPLRPPLGVTFMAWESEEEIEKWLARSRGGKIDSATASGLRALLECVRKRGCQATLKGDLRHQLPSLSGAPDVGRYVEYLDQGLLAIPQADGLLNFDPTQAEDGQLYEMDFISAPVFDSFNKPIYSITIYHFEKEVTAAEIRNCTSNLMATCMSIRKDS
jgi:DNA-binding IclR family transcriptional regulator